MKRNYIEKESCQRENQVTQKGRCRERTGAEVLTEKYSKRETNAAKTLSAALNQYLSP